MSLYESAVLVKLVVRQWDGFKKDKRVSDRVDTEYDTAGGAGNYNKRLLSKGVLGPIQSAIGRLRAEHARYTMPWRWDGVSLLPSKLYFPYTAAMRSIQDDIDAQVDNLVQQYPIFKANQQTQLGKLFDSSDYPEANELKDKFSVSFDFLPVPRADHFVVDLEEDAMARMKANLTKEMAAANAAVLGGLYDRVSDMVAHVHERLSDPDNIFRDSLITNLQQLVDVLPSLNVFDDPGLARVAEMLKNDVLITNAERLREDEGARTQIANSTYDVLAVLKENYNQIQKGT